MEACNKEEIKSGMQKNKRRPLIRQLLICSGPWTCYFLMGVCVGTPTVLVPQLRKANETISDEKASWLPTSLKLCGILWVFTLSALCVAIGRKKTHIAVCISSLIGFIIFYCSTNVNTVMISNIFLGAVASSSLTVAVLVLTEYTSSKYRGIFLTIKAATAFWGVLAANAIGTFFHWKNIPILGLVCSAYSLLNVIIWPESPYWLASKGRFRECAVSHRWLKGYDSASEKELDKLLKSQEKRRFVKESWNVRKAFETIFRRQFLKPILLSILLVCLFSFSGKLICTVYAIDILKKITNSTSTAYTGMLILDGVSVLSMYIGCAVSRLVARRKLLIGFTVLGIAFMILISSYLYLVKLTILNENKYIPLLLLAGYSISLSLGPMILSTSIIGELLPLESRTLSMCVIALSLKVINGTFVKISPFCFKTFAIHGTFLLYAILTTISLALIYFYLPETKDKTIQEIDICMKGYEEEVEAATELVNVKQGN